MTTALRRPTNTNAANGVGSPFQAGNTRNCFRCGKWRSQAGGAICKRSRLWMCSCCKANRLQG